MIRRKTPFILNRVVFYGRSLREYTALYDLSPEKLRGLRLLDCAAGTASVTAELVAQGVDARACDPRYGPSAGELASMADDDMEHVMERLKTTEEDFNWDFYGDIAGRRREAERSRDLFLESYATRPARYIAAALPDLPFRDDSFDIVICGHFLFLYENRFSPRFTAAAIDELTRVCRGTVYIYPLHPMGEEGKPSDGVERLIRSGIDASLHPAGLRFKKGAERYLAIKC